VRFTVLPTNIRQRQRHVDRDDSRLYLFQVYARWLKFAAEAAVRHLF